MGFIGKIGGQPDFSEVTIFDVNIESRLEGIEIDLAVGYDLGEEFGELGCGFCDEIYCRARDFVVFFSHYFLHE